MRKREGARCGKVALRMRSSLKFRTALTKILLHNSYYVNAMFSQFNFSSINKTEKKQIQGKLHTKIFVSNLDIAKCNKFATN